MIAPKQDVYAMAKQYGEDPTLLQAIDTQEGDILQAVRCGVPSCKDRAEALAITCKSLNHRRREFLNHLGPQAEAKFIAYFGSLWAPIGAANDPKGLNKNWIPNVLKLIGLDPLILPTPVGEEPAEPTVIPLPEGKG